MHFEALSDSRNLISATVIRLKNAILLPPVAANSSREKRR
jgi:hypothetical protein